MISIEDLLVDLVIRKSRSIFGVRCINDDVYMHPSCTKLDADCSRRVRTEARFDARMKRAEDHYVRVEGATLGSPPRFFYYIYLCMSTRYNFGVSQWIGRGHKVKTMSTTTTVPRIRMRGTKSGGDRFM